MAAPTKGGERWIANLQSVLSKLDDFAFNDRDRITIARACAEALVEAEDNIEFEYEHRNSASKWSEADLKILRETLEEKGPCLSWDEEQIRLLELVKKIGRPKKIVKSKAIEMGLGHKVDYWVNKHLPGAES